MPSPYDNVPDDVKRAAAEESAQKQPKKTAAKKAEKPASQGTPQRGPFKKKRAGVVLTREEVKAIKEGRKKLRKEMRARGLKSKRDFELTAGSLGLYFDKRNWGLLPWFLRHWLGALLALMALLLLILLLFSTVQRMRGYFTVNLSDGMFRQGFSLSDTVGFEHPTIQLFAKPAEDVPCISITQLPVDLDLTDGEHNDAYFAYTYYIRNEGDKSIDYVWSLDMNSESLNVSDAAWVMLFCDGEMRFYARPNVLTGEPEAIPGFDNDRVGYVTIPIRELAADADQFQIIASVGRLTYWRAVPISFESEARVTSGRVTGVKPMEVHKYTVVIWLEGDDVDATDEKIGGHLGVEMNFALADEEDSGGYGGRGENSFGDRWKKFWEDIWADLEF